MVWEPPFLPLTRSGNRYLKRLDTSDHQAEILGNVVPYEALAQHPGLQLSWYFVCAYAYALLELKILPFLRCQLHFLASVSSTRFSVRWWGLVWDSCDFGVAGWNHLLVLVYFKRRVHFSIRSLNLGIGNHRLCSCFSQSCRRVTL